MNEKVSKPLLFRSDARKKPQRIAVAWSGGVDSTALLLLLKAQGFDVLAWHIDHGWTEQSAEQAKQLERQAMRWHIPFFTKRVEKPAQNLEAESRQLRYAAFAELADETNCFDLGLAHHQDDQVETVCMRLLQGSGVSGCQGMRTHRKQGKLHLWRPLLQTTKKELAQYLQRQGISWIEDPSNTDYNLWRNKIRHQLLPAMQVYDVDAAKLFLRLQVQATKLNETIEVLASSVNITMEHVAGASCCRVNWLQWLQQQESVKVHLLQKMLGILFADGKVLGRRHFVAIDAWRQHGANGWVSLSGCCLYRQGEYLYLCQGQKVVADSV